MSNSTTVPPESWIPDSLYPYNPSRAAVCIFYVLFAISGWLHLVQTLRLKSWRFTALLPWACAVYCAGFITRHVSCFHQTSVGLFISSLCLLYVAPPIFAAANYFALGRTLHYIPYLSPIHPGRVVSTFIGLDVIIEVLTGQGAWRLSQWDKPWELRVGFALIKTSLILQLVLCFAFVGLQATFHRRCIRTGVNTSSIRGIMLVLYASNAAIIVRNTYRVAEVFLSSGGNKYVDTHEVFLYVFDALPMLFNSLLLNIFFPAIFLPSSNKIYLSRDGRTERKGPGWQDKRHFLLTVVDPFDLGGLLKGEDQKTRFWEQEEQHQTVKEGKGRWDSQCCYHGGKRSVWLKIVDPADIAGLLSKNSTRLALKQQEEVATAEANLHKNVEKA